MDPSPFLWELRRRSLVRARKRLRAGDAEGLHDFRVALRRASATARALGKGKVERRAAKIVRGLSSDRQREVDLALLARIRGLGLLSEDGATALEIRWRSPNSGANRTDRGATSKDEKQFRRLTRKLRSLDSHALAGVTQHLLDERKKAEAALANPPLKEDDRSLHRYRLRVKRARYVAEDLVASGRPEFEAAVQREQSAQDVLGRWNDLRLFLERIDREHKKAERRGAVRLASELEDLARALKAPLAGLRREAWETARRLSTSFSLAARSAAVEPKEKPGAPSRPRRVPNPTAGSR